MKRLVFLISLMTLTISCSVKKTASEKILGNWKTSDYLKNADNDTLYEKSTFYKTGMVTLSVCYSKTACDSITLDYTIDEAANTLQTEYDHHITNFTIEKLTKRILHIRNIEDGEIMRYVRL